MTYELTESGKKYLETSGARLDKIWEKAPVEESRRGFTRIKRTSALDRLTKRSYILESIKRGDHPIEDAFDYLKPGYRKTRGRGALKKELASMLKAGLVREVASEGSEVEVTDLRGKVLPAGEADTFIQKLQQGTSYLP